jgi:flagellar assembly factor FliW
MNPATENMNEALTEKYQIHLPYGLIGLPNLRRFDVAPIAHSWPLLAMRSAEGEKINFVVVEPHTLIGGYEPEISRDDEELLQIESAEEALILNIVTIHSLQPQYVTANLVGPVLVNRRTLIGKQTIITNYEKYSTQHTLIDERRGPKAAREMSCLF